MMDFHWGALTMVYNSLTCFFFYSFICLSSAFVMRQAESIYSGGPLRSNPVTENRSIKWVHLMRCFPFLKTETESPSETLCLLKKLDD